MEISSEAKPIHKKSFFIALVDFVGMSVGVAIFLIGILVTYDVLVRTVFRMTNSWITEVTMYLMGYITFMGAAYALKEEAHVSVDLLVLKVSPANRRILTLAVDMVLFIVAAVLTFLSFQFFLESWRSNEQSDTLLSVSLWIPYLSFFIGMIFLLVILVPKLGNDWHRQIDKKSMV